MLIGRMYTDLLWTAYMITPLIKKWVEWFKWKRLCEKCGMDPTTFELIGREHHEWVKGSFIMTHCRKCGMNENEDNKYGWCEPN
jgi:hypothetical protein